MGDSIMKTDRGTQCFASHLSGLKTAELNQYEKKVFPDCLIPDLAFIEISEMQDQTLTWYMICWWGKRFTITLMGPDTFFISGMSLGKQTLQLRVQSIQG